MAKPPSVLTVVAEAVSFDGKHRRLGTGYALVDCGNKHAHGDVVNGLAQADVRMARKRRLGELADTDMVRVVTARVHKAFLEGTAMSCRHGSRKIRHKHTEKFLCGLYALGRSAVATNEHNAGTAAALHVDHTRHERTRPFVGCDDAMFPYPGCLRPTGRGI